MAELKVEAQGMSFSQVNVNIKIYKDCVER